MQDILNISRTAEDGTVFANELHDLVTPKMVQATAIPVKAAILSNQHVQNSGNLQCTVTRSTCNLILLQGGYNGA